MEISREALIRIVCAARTAKKMVQALEALLIVRNAMTVPDQIFGNLADALFCMSGEKLTEKQDFDRDSRTMELLNSDMSNADAADAFIHMAWQNSRPKPPEFPWPDSMEEQVRKNGGFTPKTGYVPPKETDETPEGEWR